MTSSVVGWVLLDGDTLDGSSLDDDAFEVESADELTDRAAAAVRGARAIAASSGQDVRSIGIAWSAEVADQARQLIERLGAAGLDDVRVVPRELLDTEDADDADAIDSQLAMAQAAADAVVTNAVAVTPISRVRVTCAGPGRKAMRIVGAAAATVGLALLTVGSQFDATDPQPTAGQSASGPGTPEIVSAVVPRALDRPARSTVEPEELDVVKVYSAAPQSAAVQARPTQRTATPVAVAPQQVDVPEAASVVVNHLPAAAMPGPADSAELFAPGPVPVAAAVPVAPAPGPAPALPPPFTNPLFLGLP